MPSDSTKTSLPTSLIAKAHVPLDAEPIDLRGRTLVSHALCPYVQRAAIVLLEKAVPFERRDIDLANKPAWFLSVSPLGKTPVLLVNDAVIFESSVICEFLDETIQPHLHPRNALQRARHRSWMEFGSTVLNTIGSFYSAADEAELAKQRQALEAKFRQLEVELASGPFFDGAHFSIVDAVFAPVFRYFDVFDQIDDFGVFAQTPKVRAWRSALRLRASVIDAVSPDYNRLLMAFLVNRNTALSKRIDATSEAGTTKA